MADSGVSGTSVEEAIKTRLQTKYVQVTDMSNGCGQVLEAIIVSPEFSGKTTLARNRMVNALLKDEVALVHAWSQKCYTPEQWEKIKPKDDEGGVGAS